MVGEKTTLTFIDEDHDEIESVTLNMDCLQVLDLIEKVNRFCVGKDRLSHDKTGFIAVDLVHHELYLQVKAC